MNLGKTILELRKKKNVTQEDLAAELGVTAAAVSKWENGYTLPDVLMLCALADCFQVTTDELLGRSAARKQAIVVAAKEELGQKIAELAAKYDIQTRAIFTDYDAAAAFEAAHTAEIHYMFIAADCPQEEVESKNGIIHVHIQQISESMDAVLDGIELYLKNEDAFKNIANTAAAAREKK